MSKGTVVAGRDEGMLALTAPKLAERLGISLRKVRRMDGAGELPAPIRFGRSVRWSVDEIRGWLLAGAPDRQTWDAMKEGNSERRVG